jgi:hypothetical protein
MIMPEIFQQISAEFRWRIALFRLDKPVQR